MPRSPKKQRRQSRDLDELLHASEKQQLKRPRTVTVIVSLFCQQVLKTFSGHVEIREAAHDGEIEWRAPGCFRDAGWESCKVTDVGCNKEVFQIMRGLTREWVLVERCSVD